MVKGCVMLISEFAKVAKLPLDTVRLYVKRGLLKPTAGRLGGSNPYQEFSASDVARARLVRLARSLGYTLREIAVIANELESQGMSRERRVDLFEQRLALLEKKGAEIAEMTTYLRAKIEWIKNGERGPEPEIDSSREAASVAGLIGEIARPQTARPGKIKVAKR